MGKIPINATTMKDIKKIGEGHEPIPAPKEVKKGNKVMGYPKPKGSAGKHSSGWF